MNQETNLAVKNERLALELDTKHSTIIASLLDSSISFGPLLTRVSFRDHSGKAYDPASSLVRGWKAAQEEVDTPLGKSPGITAALEDVAGLPARLKWEIALIGEEDALFRTTLENRSTGQMTLLKMAPLAFRGADPGLSMGAGYSAWRFFRTGYQSWSPAGSTGVMDKDVKPGLLNPFQAGASPLTPYSNRPGIKASDWMAQIVEPGLSLSTLIGFVTSSAMSGRVEFEVLYDRFRRLEAVSDPEGRLVDSGESVCSEWCMISMSNDPVEQQARYYELWGKAMEARDPGPRTGWCSWYFCFAKVDEGVVTRNLSKLKEHNDKVQVVQIDDGFEKCPGEWIKWNPKFKTHPRTVAERIKEHGFQPGLWLAPFLVSRQAPVAKQHPEWMVKNKEGRPKIALVHPKWKGTVMHALDATHPGAQRWLHDIIRTIVHDYGFSYLKLDFLYAGAVPGFRRSRSSTGAFALRRGLEIIRGAAGEEAYLVGCGCPLGPGVGMVDAMRVSQDASIKWSTPWADWIAGMPVAPGARNCFKNNIARMLMHGRLWANDPDCFLLRDEKGGLRAEEIQSELTLFFLCGGASFLSEHLPGLPEERLGLWLDCLPPLGEAARPVDLMERGFPELLVLKRADSALVAVFNWSEKAGKKRLDLGRLGLRGAWHVFDYWAKNYRGVVSDKMELGSVPPRGVKYLRLSRADDTPRVLATSLHMGMGETGFQTSREGDDLELAISLPGRRKGKVWAVFPRGAVRMREINFTDQWEGRISP